MAALLLLAGPRCAPAVELKPQTVAAFDRYIQQAEQRMDGRKSFLWAGESDARARRVRQGEMLVEPAMGTAETPVAFGLVHDWVGTVFIPGATLEQTLAVGQDYNRHKDIYRPEVMDSRILAHTGNDFRISLRLLKKKVIAVVLDTEHEVHYERVDGTRWRSRSRSTRIAEVKNAGKPNERELPAGTGDGYLWRLYSYWRYEERDGGTWVECEAISLTRDLPTGLGWLIEPIIRSLARDSLVSTLRETRASLAPRALLRFHQVPEAAATHVPALREDLAGGEGFGQFAHGAPVDAGDGHRGAGTMVHWLPPSCLRIQSVSSPMLSTSRSGAGSASDSGWKP